MLSIAASCRGDRLRPRLAPLRPLERRRKVAARAIVAPSKKLVSNATEFPLAANDPWLAAAITAISPGTLRTQVMNATAATFHMPVQSFCVPGFERDARDDLMDDMSNTIALLKSELEQLRSCKLGSSAVGGVAAGVADVRSQVAQPTGSLGTVVQQSMEKRLPDLLRPLLDRMHESTTVKIDEINNSFNQKLVAIGIAAHDEASKEIARFSASLMISKSLVSQSRVAVTKESKL